MKKIFLLFTIILFTTTLKAQVGTDLQFSQIVTLKGEVTNPTMNQAYTIGTVPTGKVWKVIVFGANNNSLNYAFAPPLSKEEDPVDGANLYVDHPLVGSCCSTVRPYAAITGPDVYINENVYVLCFNVIPTELTYTFQAIEYTVIP